MNRKTLQQLILALVAVLSLSAMAEAAGPKKVIVHRRPKHSSRVASGATRKKTTVTTKSRTTTVKKPARPQQKPTTKPR
jgi:hypothetical protein